MIEDENYEEETQDEVPTGEDELTALKKRAKLMGINFHPNIGVDKLRAKVNNKLSEDTPGAEDDAQGIKEVPVTSRKATPNRPLTIKQKLSRKCHEPLTESEYKRWKLGKDRRDAGRLIRIRVTCMNPNKKDWEGEIISVGSAKMGTYKKYIPFNTPDGWHVPKAIYEVMKERQCTIFQSTTDEKGRKIRKAKLIPEFSIEVLPPLSEAERDALAKKQAMANGTA
jgi:hypothetical protein